MSSPAPTTSAISSSRSAAPRAASIFKARAFFAGFPRPVTFLWIDSPRVQSLFRLLEHHGLSAGEDGKGRSCWLSYGYLLATGDCDVIALHDCDIRNYERQFLARLCYPVVNPNLDFEFCKAYYARVTDRMHGRVTRLFMTPLIRAISGMAPNTPLLDFLDSFRYPLAGEFAMKANLARVNRIPGDWGLEVGVLAEVYRNCSPSRICQVDLADNYDHKHQDAVRRRRLQGPPPHDPRHRQDALPHAGRRRRGLHRRALPHPRSALRPHGRGHHDPLLRRRPAQRPDLRPPRRGAGRRHLRRKPARRPPPSSSMDPLGLPLIPNWNRVVAAIPDFFELLLAAVEEDAAVRSTQAA